MTEALPALYNVGWFLSRWCSGVINPTTVVVFSGSCHRSTNMIMDGAKFRIFSETLECTKWIFSHSSSSQMAVPVRLPILSGLKYLNNSWMDCHDFLHIHDEVH